MTRHKLATRLVALLGLVLPLAATAQEFGSIDTLYNSGVEAYFRGCSTDAESAFSSLLGQDPNDPRAYYFRALTLMRQGRDDEARSDMELGAEIEARAPRRFDIGKMLERVQGSNRLVLEQYRNRARTAASMTPTIGAQRSLDTNVLREHRVVPLDEFARPGGPQSFPVQIPQTPPPSKLVLPPAASPPTPAAAATDANPFGDDASEAPQKAGSKKPPANSAKGPAKAAPADPAKVMLPPQPKPAPPAPASKPADDDPGNPF